MRRVRDVMGMTNVALMVPFCRTIREADAVLQVISSHGLTAGDNLHHHHHLKPWVEKAPAASHSGVSSPLGRITNTGGNGVTKRTTRGDEAILAASSATTTTTTTTTTINISGTIPSPTASPKSNPVNRSSPKASPSASASANSSNEAKRVYGTSPAAGGAAGAAVSAATTVSSSLSPRSPSAAIATASGVGAGVGAGADGASTAIGLGPADSGTATTFSMKKRSKSVVSNAFTANNNDSSNSVSGHHLNHLHLGSHHQKNEEDLQIYMMCEIPNNVICIEEFLSRFDGISIGSNDLTQLCLGVDRDSAQLSDEGLFDEREPGVKKLIEIAVLGAKKLGKYCGICGQAPSDYPEMVKFLVDLGIESMSVDPGSAIATKMTVIQAEADAAGGGSSAHRKAIM